MPKTNGLSLTLQGRQSTFKYDDLVKEFFVGYESESRQKVINTAVVSLWSHLSPSGPWYLTIDELIAAIMEKYNCSQASVVSTALAFHAGQHAPAAQIRNTGIDYQDESRYD